MMRLAFVVFGWVMASAAAAQTEPRFSPGETQACVEKAAARSKRLSGHGVLDCVGRAAQACMRSPGGDTTVGMVICFQGELGYWDGRLNAAYAKRMAAAKSDDTEMASIRATTTSLVDTLLNMQRSWMSFRDAACLHEAAQWMGGTGAGPAAVACHMHETARQALKLEGWWAQ